MAALAKAAVSLYPTSPSASDFRTDRAGLVMKRLKLVLTGQGGQTNTIGARATGFESFVSCSNLFDDENNKVYLATIDPVLNVILLTATAADTVADVTSNAAYITITGVPRITASLT